MAELFGAIIRGLGVALDAIYGVVPSYGLAIIILTLATRAVLIPLTLKQIRSTQAMTAIQPKLKALQREHKGDRQKLNEEVMKLYKEHNVNPMGGCLPLLAQMPVFIALFTLLRAAIPIAVETATLPAGGPIPVSTYTAEQLSTTFCRPANGTPPTADGRVRITCIAEDAEEKQFLIGGFTEERLGDELASDLIGLCRPIAPDGATELDFSCSSALGTGHLPRDGQLFDAITEDKASFLGMRLGCTASQIGSDAAARACTSNPDAAGGANLIPYYLLIALIVGSSYFQAKQMAARATGPAAQQQKIMTRVLPVFFGFISLSFPAGTNIYFFATNAWTIAQQHLVLGRLDAAKADGAKPAGGKAARSDGPTKTVKSKPVDAAKEPGSDNGGSMPKGHTPKKGKPTPKRKKRR